MTGNCRLGNIGQPETVSITAETAASSQFDSFPTHCALTFTQHAIAGGLELDPTAWAASLQSHLWGCHSSPMHTAGGIASRTHQTHHQGNVLCPGTAQADQHCCANTSSPLLQTCKALLSSLGFPPAAPPPQYHLNCQVAQRSLVTPTQSKTAAFCFQQSAPQMCSHRQYTSGLIPPVLAHACKRQI